MPLQAIQTVRNAEQEAQRFRTEQLARAKKLIEDTHAEGRALLEKTEHDAQERATGLMRAAAENAKKAAETVLDENEAACQALRAASRKKLPGAEKLILERVVSG